MPQDVSVGSVIQEITFWVSLRHAVASLRSQLECPEVVLTLNALKAKRRFNTVIKFESDTGLKDIEDHVNDYMVLMKDFPVKDLHAADTLSSIITAIEAIFVHLRKIRCTNYPIERAISLIEAISRDLLNQSLWVLKRQKLMIIPFDNFSKVVNEFSEVISVWNDELEKFKVLLREVFKRQNSKTVRFHFYFNLPHKELETRLEILTK